MLKELIRSFRKIWSVGDLDLEGEEGLDEVSAGEGGDAFLNIAPTDLIPEMHRTTSIRESMNQIVWLMAGIVIIYLIILLK